MKKITCFFLLCFLSVALHGQNHLRVSSITGLPLFPADSAYEANPQDSIYITVVNDSGQIFNDTIDVFITANSLPTDTLYTGIGPDSIASGDSVMHIRNNYIFSPVYFDDGDNIVVVWPMARLTPVTVDSLTFHLYFISLLASVDNYVNESLILYPNPSTQYISFRVPDKFIIKQVRIHTLSGKEVYRNTTMPKFISVSDWKQGLYIIEIENTNGKSQVFKLQKN